MTTSLSKKGKGIKRRKMGKEKKENGGKREKKKEKDGFWLTQKNKQNLFWEKNHILSPGVKNIKYF